MNGRVRRVLSAARIEAFRACRRRGRFDVDDVLDYVVGALALDAVERTMGPGDGCETAYDVTGRRGEAPKVTMRNMHESIVSILTALDPTIVRARSEHAMRAAKTGAVARAKARYRDVFPVAEGE